MRNVKSFIKNNWFKIATIIVLSASFIVVIEVSNCDCFNNFKFFVGFVNKNVAGIIFLIFVVYLLLVYRWPCKLCHNYKILKKYKRENNNNDKKFKTMRCYEDGDEKGRHNVYLIDEENTAKTYQLIVDYYTLKELGYGSASRKDSDKLFSKNDYEIRSRIKIYNIISDISSVIKLKP